MADPNAANPTAQPIPSAVAERAAALLEAHQQTIWRRTDRLLAGLLACEWLAGIILASYLSPRTWDGEVSRTHPHVWAALLLGGVITAFPIALVLLRPGTCLTRQVVAVAQMLMSALLIHLGGGRVEMHFHVFGSLAFLAFYRDWRVLITASIVVSLDHLARGLFAPMSVYGILSPGYWRTVEHAAWVIFEDLFLVAACVQGVREMRGIALNRALLEASYRDVEAKVEERTQQLKDAQDNLVRTARTAGMAEIATSVLHNVGNVLNSVNVSANVVTAKLRQSEVGSLTQVSQILDEHASDLGTFLTADERGKMVPEFLRDLASCLHDEQASILKEIESLTNGIDHIKHVVAAQQSMAKRSDVRQACNPAAILESAINIQGATLSSNIDLRKNIAPALPVVTIDQHRVLQILINLIGNARQAVAARSSGGAKWIELGVSIVKDGDAAATASGERLRFTVTDNGIGIAPANLTRIFSHGFTTKADGHGFGLHSAANAAREMGGALTVASEGAGRGATFTLDVPFAAPISRQPEQAGADQDNREITSCSH